MHRSCVITLHAYQSHRVAFREILAEQPPDQQKKTLAELARLAACRAAESEADWGRVAEIDAAIHAVQAALDARFTSVSPEDHVVAAFLALSLMGKFHDLPAAAEHAAHQMFWVADASAAERKPPRRTRTPELPPALSRREMG